MKRAEVQDACLQLRDQPCGSRSHRHVFAKLTRRLWKSQERQLILRAHFKVTNVPFVLIQANWYGRVTEREAVTHVPASDRRCLMEADRTPAVEAAAPPV